jgi:hypothetical protein
VMTVSECSKLEAVEVLPPATRLCATAWWRRASACPSSVSRNVAVKHSSNYMFVFV